MKKQFLFSLAQEDTAIRDANPTSKEAGDDIVMFIDDINPEVIDKVVEIFNTDNSMAQVEEYLNSTSKVTPDEIEFIVDQITNYLAIVQGEEKEQPEKATIAEVTQASPNIIIASIPGELKAGTEKMPLEGKVFEDDNEEDQTSNQQKPNTMFPDNLDTITNKDSAEQKAPEAETETGKKVRKTRTANNSDKKLSPEDYIKSLQEKMEVAKLLNVEVPEIPSGLSKASRELMTEYQKEQEALTSKYLLLINEL